MLPLSFSYILFLLFACYSAPSLAQDPSVVADRALSKLFANTQNTNFFDGKTLGYSTAVILDGVYELVHVFPFLNNYTKKVSSLLDGYCTEPSYACTEILGHQNIPWTKAIGDDIGLFPVVFLDRAVYNEDHKITPYSNATDIHVATWVGEDWIEKWPIRLPDGTFSRNSGWEGQKGTNSFLWCDDQFMGTTLLNRLSRVLGQASFAQEAAKQQYQFDGYARATDGLYWHGFNHANAEHSCCKWGRANGWVMMSHLESLLALNTLRKNGNSASEDEAVEASFQQILELFQKHSEAAIKFQDLSSGLWHQIIDDPSTFLETSVSGMFLLGFIEGVQNRWLSPTTFGPSIELAWKGIASRVRIDGTVTGICEGTGIEPNVTGYQKRSTAYNVSGPGLGGVLRAIAAYGRYKSKN